MVLDVTNHLSRHTGLNKVATLSGYIDSHAKLFWSNFIANNLLVVYKTKPKIVA